MLGNRRHFGEKSKNPARDLVFVSLATLLRTDPAVAGVLDEQFQAMLRTVLRQVVSSVMRALRTYVMLAACILPMTLAKGSAQNARDELEDASGTSLTAQQWARRVEAARARSEEFVANARTGMADPVQSEEEEVKVADQRAMNDPSLVPGDIVSTSTGFLVYVGSEDAEADRRHFRPASVAEMAAAHDPRSSVGSRTKFSH